MVNRRVAIVGSNPSIQSPDNSPFHPNTKSRIIVDRWFRDIICDITYINLSNIKIKGNQPLTRTQIQKNLPGFKKQLLVLGCDRVIALGKTVEWALTKAEISHLAMPHPSGLNRQLNDSEYVLGKIKELRKFING